MPQRRSQKPQNAASHRTIRVTAHTAKVVARILRRRTERKIEGAHGAQFGFRRGKGIRFSIGVLKISVRTLETDEELWTGFSDWQNVFHRA
jgi:hypothetical protein